MATSDVALDDNTLTGFVVLVNILTLDDDTLTGFVVLVKTLTLAVGV